MNELGLGGENGGEQNLKIVKVVLDGSFLFGGSIREEEVITNLSLRSILKRIGGEARLTDEVIDVYKYTFL